MARESWVAKSSMRCEATRRAKAQRCSYLPAVEPARRGGAALELGSLGRTDLASIGGMQRPLLLASLSVATSLTCNKLQPSYPSSAIPPYVGKTGPFGTVCEVRDPMDLPRVPEAPDASAGSGDWAVRSRFPDTFMEAINLTSSPVAVPRMLAAVTSNVACGPYRVAKAAPSMDEKVWGIKGGWTGWMLACQVCGKALEPQIGIGWFCQFDSAAHLATGVWLKRNVASGASSVTIDATPAGHRQQILGFGGAFTDATAYASSLLPAPLATAWHQLYFGQNGSAGYTMGRCASCPAAVFTPAPISHATVHNRSIPPSALPAAAACHLVAPTSHAPRTLSTTAHPTSI